MGMTEDYVALDLETTGLNPKEDCIIEIGAVKVQKGRQAEELSVFVKPDRLLPDRVTRLTGITQEEADGGMETDEAVSKTLDFIGGLPLLGHSILFDYSFLKKAAVNRGLAFEKEGVDTLRLARRFLPGLERKRLCDLCEYYGIVYRAHRALEDARAAGILYQKLAEQFYTKDREAFAPRRLLYKAKKDTPATKAQKEQLYRLAGRHKLIIDYREDRLTRSQASRMIDRILSEYGRCSDALRNEEIPPSG